MSNDKLNTPPVTGINNSLGTEVKTVMAIAPELSPKKQALDEIQTSIKPSLKNNSPKK